MIPGYPSHTYAHTFELNLGSNEFGASKGYIHVDIPLFMYDEHKKCLKGGYHPPAGTPSIEKLCANAYTPSPQAKAPPLAPPAPPPASAPPPNAPPPPPTPAPTAAPVLPPPTAHPTGSPTVSPVNKAGKPCYQVLNNHAFLWFVLTEHAWTLNATITLLDHVSDLELTTDGQCLLMTCLRVMQITDGGTTLKTTHCNCAENEFEFKCHGAPPEWMDEGLHSEALVNGGHGCC